MTSQEVATRQRYAPKLVNPKELNLRDEAQVMGYFEYLVQQIPLMESDSFSFVAQALAVEDVADLIGELEDKLPKAEDVQQYGVLKVNDLHRLPSTVADSPLSHYLIVDSTITTGPRSGETLLWQTSAGEPTAKLVKIYEAGRLPALVETRKVQQATRAGYFPVNLIVRTLGGEPAAPANAK